jgi:ribosome-associated protein
VIKKAAAKKKKKAGSQALDAKGLALLAAEAAFDKKGFDVLVIDVTEKSPVTDMMVIASARSTTHLRAVSDSVEKELLKHGVKASHRDRGIGGDTDWILLDFFDVMVHIFVNDVRAHYQLERLYKDAKTIAQFH